MSCRNTPISPSISRRTIPRCATRLCALWNNGAPEGAQPPLPPGGEDGRACFAPRQTGEGLRTADYPPPVWWGPISSAQHLALLIVLDPQVCNLLLTPQVAQGVLQLGELNEEVVLGVEEGSAHRALEVEGQPLLNTAETTTLR